MLDLLILAVLRFDVCVVLVVWFGCDLCCLGLVYDRKLVRLVGFWGLFAPRCVFGFWV